MTPNLVEQLRALARAEHDDLSIADEAADRIEELEKLLEGFIKWGMKHIALTQHFEE